MKKTNIAPDAQRADAYQIVTDRIIAQLEEGIIPWEKPWTGSTGGAVSGSSRKAYSLINQLLLPADGTWYTWNQIQEKGGHVRKGEKSSKVIFYKDYHKTELDPRTGEEVEKIYPVPRVYNVFHISQIDGLPDSEASAPAPCPEADRDADALIAGYCDHEGITLEITLSSRAYYSPAADLIRLPRMDQYPVTAEYYSTAYHEMTHSTGHASRLARITKPAAKGSTDYSKEELVAEIGSAMLMHLTGQELDKTARNSAAYIQGWLKALRNDKRLIVSAASQAQKAVDYILSHITAPAPSPDDGDRAPETDPETEKWQRKLDRRAAAADLIDALPWDGALKRWFDTYGIESSMTITWTTGSASIDLEAYYQRISASQKATRELLSLISLSPDETEAARNRRMILDYWLMRMDLAMSEAVGSVRQIEKAKKTAAQCGRIAALAA